MVAPTWVLTEYLLNCLVNGVFPAGDHTEDLNSRGAIVDACFAHGEKAEETAQPSNRFRPPSPHKQNHGGINARKTRSLMPP